MKITERTSKELIDWTLDDDDYSEMARNELNDRALNYDKIKEALEEYNLKINKETRTIFVNKVREVI